MSELVTFKEAMLYDATVSNGVRAGLSPEEIIGHLVTEKRKLLDRLVKLHAIAPRKITINGQTMIWRCPDHLVPDEPTIF